jgi:hypothetical protein
VGCPTFVDDPSETINVFAYVRRMVTSWQHCSEGILSECSDILFGNEQYQQIVSQTASHMQTVETHAWRCSKFEERKMKR